MSSMLFSVLLVNPPSDEYCADEDGCPNYSADIPGDVHSKCEECCARCDTS